jgi:hypothetical protein
MNVAQLAVTPAFAMAAGTFAHEQDADSLAGPVGRPSHARRAERQREGPVPLRLD